MVARYDYHRRSLGDGPYGARAKKKSGSLKKSIFLLVFFAFIISLFIYVFPEVDVVLIPATEKVENKFELLVDSHVKQADLAQGVAPARLVELSDSLEKSFPATGEKNVGEKASGLAVFYNQTGLIQPLTPENDLVTDNGLVFHVKHNIEIPKAEVSPEGNIVYGTITAPIVAAEAGEAGNVGAVRLTIIDLPFTKQSKIYAQVKDQLSGGSDKTIKVVSEDDLKKAQNELIGELRPKLRLEMENKLNEGEVLNDKLLDYELAKVDKVVEVDEEVDEFKMKVTLKLKALVWNENKIKQLVIKKISDNLTDNKKVVSSSKDIFKVEVKEADFNKEQAKLEIYTVNQVTLPIDISSLREKIKGLKEYQARRLLLAEPSIKDVRFKFSYSITSRIPKNSNRINIRLVTD